MGLAIAILLGMWPCMYVDVNECNVCSVCMFFFFFLGILGLLFRIAEAVKMGLQEVRLATVTVSFFFLVFYLFLSHKSRVCGLICAI